MEPKTETRPTKRSGWRVSVTSGGVVAGSATLFFALYAMLLGEPVLWLWTFAALAAFSLQALTAVWTLRRLEPERKAPERILRFSPFLCSVGLHNRSRIPAFSLKVQDVIDGVPVDKPCFFFRINAGAEQSTFYRHAFVHRGRVSFEGFILSTTHPLGLLRISVFLPLPEQRMVFPDAVLPGRLQASLEHRVDQDALSLREFAPGDPPHAIHWPASMRSGRLLSRVGMHRAQRTVWIQLDNRLVPDERGGYRRPADRLERRISAVAGAARKLLDTGWDVGIVTRGGQMPPVAGIQNFDHVLRYLAQLSPADGPFSTPPYQDRVLDASGWPEE